MSSRGMEKRDYSLSKAGTPVWTKVSGMWWPGEITTDFPPELVANDKKERIAVVKFCKENDFLVIYKEPDIKLYTIDDKEDLIRRGLNRLKTNKPSELENFKEDVKNVEKICGGDEDIIERLIAAPQTPKQPAWPKLFKSAPPSASTSSTTPVHGQIKFNFRKSGAKKAKSNVSTPEVDFSGKKFKCDDCDFGADRIGSLIAHRKGHTILFNDVKPSKPTKNKSPAKAIPTPQPPTTPAKAKIEQIPVPSPEAILPAKKLTQKKSPGRPAREPIRTAQNALPPKKRKVVKKDILADWSDEEGNNARSKSESTSQEKSDEEDELELKAPIKTKKELFDTFEAILNATKPPDISSLKAEEVIPKYSFNDFPKKEESPVLNHDEAMEDNEEEERLRDSVEKFVEKELTEPLNETEPQGTPKLTVEEHEEKEPLKSKSTIVTRRVSGTRSARPEKFNSPPPTPIRARTRRQEQSLKEDNNLVTTAAKTPNSDNTVETAETTPTLTNSSTSEVNSTKRKPGRPASTKKNAGLEKIIADTNMDEEVILNVEPSISNESIEQTTLFSSAQSDANAATSHDDDKLDKLQNSLKKGVGHAEEKLLEKEHGLFEINRKEKSPEKETKKMKTPTVATTTTTKNSEFFVTGISADDVTTEERSKEEIKTAELVDSKSVDVSIPLVSSPITTSPVLVHSSSPVAPVLVTASKSSPIRSTSPAKAVSPARTTQDGTVTTNLNFDKSGVQTETLSISSTSTNSALANTEVKIDGLKTAPVIKDLSTGNSTIGSPKYELEHSVEQPIDKKLDQKVSSAAIPTKVAIISNLAQMPSTKPGISASTTTPKVTAASAPALPKLIPTTPFARHPGSTITPTTTVNTVLQQPPTIRFPPNVSASAPKSTSPMIVNAATAPPISTSYKVLITPGSAPPTAPVTNTTGFRTTPAILNARGQQGRPTFMHRAQGQPTRGPTRPPILRSPRVSTPRSSVGQTVTPRGFVGQNVTPRSSVGQTVTGPRGGVQQQFILATKSTPERIATPPTITLPPLSRPTIPNTITQNLAPQNAVSTTHNNATTSAVVSQNSVANPRKRAYSPRPPVATTTAAPRSPKKAKPTVAITSAAPIAAEQTNDNSAIMIRQALEGTITASPQQNSTEATPPGEASQQIEQMYHMIPVDQPDGTTSYIFVHIEGTPEGNAVVHLDQTENIRGRVVPPGDDDNVTGLYIDRPTPFEDIVASAHQAPAPPPENNLAEPQEQQQFSLENLQLATAEGSDGEQIYYLLDESSVSDPSVLSQLLGMQEASPSQ